MPTTYLARHTYSDACGNPSTGNCPDIWRPSWKMVGMKYIPTLPNVGVIAGTPLVDSVAAPLRGIYPLSDVFAECGIRPIGNAGNMPVLDRIPMEPGSGRGNGIAPVAPPTPPDMRSSASGGWSGRLGDRPEGKPLPCHCRARGFAQSVARLPRQGFREESTSPDQDARGIAAAVAASVGGGKRFARLRRLPAS